MSNEIENLTRVAAHAGSVGILVDRCVNNEQAIGTVFLVDENTVATCAHLAVLYSDFLSALKVAFPSNSCQYSISKAFFHPKFDQEPAREMAKRALKDPVPALALQDHNVVLLTLSSDISELKASQRTEFNRKLSLDPLPRVKGLAGAVEELGLALVIQTVSNARKDGVLYITDERNRPIARIFFRDGKIRHAKFGQLQNEYAIYEMFQRPLNGQFFLKSQEQPDWQADLPPIERSTEMLLLEAHRRIDETPKLIEKLGGATVGYVKAGETLNIEALPAEAGKYAARIHAQLDGGTPLSDLYDLIGLDTYTVASTLVELAWSKQAYPVNLEAPPSVAPEPLELAAYEALSKWDEIVSLQVSPSGRPQIRRGNLVGMLSPNDPYHLVHTVKLPYQAAGCPLFKNGKLIGMHCGMLPLEPSLHALPHHLHQMMWIESVRLCMLAMAEGATRSAPKQARPSVGMIRPQMLTQGKKVCPKCQSAMISAAMFCGTCGTAL